MTRGSVATSPRRKPGVPLTLRLTVVDASTCRPLGAPVDVWHCDAAGVYSGVQGNAGSFLRGIQRTDARASPCSGRSTRAGILGRTVHVHVKVSLGGNVVHTGQLYFSDAVTDAVYRRKPTAAARTVIRGTGATRSTGTAAGARR